MQGELEAMIDGLIKTDKEHLLSLHEETGRLKKLIEGIEELSKAEASILEMKRQRVHLKPFLSNIQGRFEQLFRDKGVGLQLECENDLTLYADPDKVSQIVINLLSNAMRVTDKGGRVTIRAGKKGDEYFIEVAIPARASGRKTSRLSSSGSTGPVKGALGSGLPLQRNLPMRTADG
jgi:signal transduction histidine kinase